MAVAQVNASLPVGVWMPNECDESERLEGAPCSCVHLLGHLRAVQCSDRLWNVCASGAVIAVYAAPLCQAPIVCLLRCRLWQEYPRRAREAHHPSRSAQGVPSLARGLYQPTVTVWLRSTTNLVLRAAALCRRP